ncbi:hypothetical protein C5K27_02580, partial [Shigella flexneri]
VILLAVLVDNKKQ